MKQAIAIQAAIILLSACPLYADFGVENKGSWPDYWPKELAELREQSRTLEGPTRGWLRSVHAADPDLFLRRMERQTALC